MNYLFETKEFGISKDAFHLLRSKYNFKTYEHKEITTLTFEKGKQINNWVVVFIIGTLMTAFSAYYMFNLYNYMFDENTVHIYVEQIVLPVLPFLLGIYCLYTSLKVGPILKIRLHDNTTKCLPLSKVNNTNQLDLLINIIKNSTEFGHKTKVKTNN